MRSLADIRPLHFADVTVDGAVWPVFGWAVAGPHGTILVDTGMIDSTPELDREWGPVLRPWPELGEVVAVVNTHLHFDHCGGNRRFAGTPTHVQRAELAAAVPPDYLVDWVHFPGESYVVADGDAEAAPGISLLFTPGHSPGHQAVVVETDAGRVVLAGDVTYSMRELIAGGERSIDRVHAVRPVRVYLAHHERPWEPPS
jgi:N-acyl homoserine lactone hydrolase